jgi:hypothetical protein
MSYIMVDVETTRSGCPVPGGKSVMTELGAVLVRDPSKTFYADFRDIEYGHIHREMRRFVEWLTEHAGNRPMFISDNNGFDWGWVNYYLWMYAGSNPFGHSSTNLGSLYKGMKKNMRESFKHLRRTKHTHHPVDDAMGNVEALIHMRDRMGLKL